MSGLARNVNYVASAVLFLVGLYAVAARPNLVKKVMGLIIMQESVFLFFVSLGIVGSGEERVVVPGFRASTLVNPVPQAVVLIGMVVAAGITALALALCVRIYSETGTLEHHGIFGAEGS